MNSQKLASIQTFTKLSSEKMSELNAIMIANPDMRISEAYITWLVAQPKCPHCGDVKPFELRMRMNCGKTECKKAALARPSKNKGLVGVQPLSGIAKMKKTLAKTRTIKTALRLKENTENRIAYEAAPVLCKYCGKPISFDPYAYRKFKAGKKNSPVSLTFCSLNCAAKGKRRGSPRRSAPVTRREVIIEVKTIDILDIIKNYFKKIFTKRIKEPTYKIKPSKEHLNTLKKRYGDNNELLEKYLYTMIDKMGRKHSPMMIKRFNELYERKESIEKEIHEVRKKIKK